MNRMIFSFSLPGDPVPASRPRFAKGRVFIADRYRQYKSKLVAELKRKATSSWPFDMDLYLVVDFHRKTKRKVDIDNLVKTVMDALQESGVVKNDSCIKRLLAEIKFSKENPKLVFQLFHHK